MRYPKAETTDAAAAKFIGGIILIRNTAAARHKTLGALHKAHTTVVAIKPLGRAR